MPQKEILKYLYGLQTLGIRPGLRRIRRLLNGLGNPERAFPSVHVAGTNGKGSTSAMIESILMEAGYRVGLYTSPHLLRFNERIRVNKRTINGKDLASLSVRLRKALEAAGCRPTFFEFTTALAFEYFRLKRVDIAVLETGMGGRFDATNVVSPLVSVITNIGLDHTAYLGTGLPEIAFEKAGVIKQGAVVITGERSAPALSVIRKTAEEKGARLYVLGRDFISSPAGVRSNRFDYSGIRINLNKVDPGLYGGHQFKNAAVAMAVVETLGMAGFKVSGRRMRSGLKRVLWPGRLQIVRKRPLVILDSAHNPDGAKTLKDALKDLEYRRLFLVIGIMRDKDAGKMLGELAPISSFVIATMPATERAVDAGILVSMARPYGKPATRKKTVKEACLYALKEATETDAICVTGSIYTVGEALTFFFEKKVLAARAIE